jgi:hypothetical protein
MYSESLLINKLKWFWIQFIKKYQTQYRYLGKYLLDRFKKNQKKNQTIKSIFVFLIDNCPSYAK